MTNALLQIKFKERLNKLASMDYDNIECWQIQEAFNKAQLEWVRRSLRGLNNRKESSEQSVVMIDDLQVLLKSDPFTNLVKRPLYYESELVPLDYFSFIRASVYGVDDCCPERLFTVYLGEEANVNALLGDSYKSPNFEWGETFCTIAGNKVKIFTNDKFEIVRGTLTYYRRPQDVGFINCADPRTGGAFSKDYPCEFKDDIVELIIDEAVAILAGDIADITNYQRNVGNAQRNS
jgi:hypothetical protein